MQCTCGHSKTVVELGIPTFPPFLMWPMEQLGSARVGCTMGNMIVNHLMFADDICVFSPSISGIQVFWIFVVTILLNMKSPLV